MATLTLNVTNGRKPVVITLERNSRVIAEAIKRFARQRGVSPLSVEYRVG